MIVFIEMAKFICTCFQNMYKSTYLNLTKLFRPISCLSTKNSFTLHKRELLLREVSVYFSENRNSQLITCNRPSIYSNGRRNHPPALVTSLLIVNLSHSTHDGRPESGQSDAKLISVTCPREIYLCCFVILKATAIISNNCCFVRWLLSLFNCNARYCCQLYATLD